MQLEFLEKPLAHHNNSFQYTAFVLQSLAVGILSAPVGRKATKHLAQQQLPVRQLVGWQLLLRWQGARGTTTDTTRDTIRFLAKLC
jgi:hypothetical protein